MFLPSNYNATRVTIGGNGYLVPVVAELRTEDVNPTIVSTCFNKAEDEGVELLHQTLDMGRSIPTNNPPTVPTNKLKYGVYHNQNK